MIKKNIGIIFSILIVIYAILFGYQYYNYRIRKMEVSKEVRKAMEWGSMAGWDSPLANPDIWRK